MTADFEEIADFCGLTPVLEIAPLPAGLENDTCVVTTPDGRRVVRASQQRSVRQVDAEVSFVTELRALGFEIAPRFLPLRDETHVVGYRNMVVSSYEYIPGEMLMHITEDQFDELLEWLRLLILAEQRINTNVLAARSAFPDPTSVSQRFERLLTRAEPTDLDPGDIQGVAHFVPSESQHAIHSDIHVKNLIWAESGSLAGFLDFDDCCVGSQLIEFTTFVRGACFAPVADFKPERLARTWQALRPCLFRGGSVPSSDHLYTALL